MKKIIAFSLWGDTPMYTVGAVRNAELVPEVYGDSWTSRFYISNDVPSGVVEKLKSLSQTEVVEIDESPDWFGMFWRFYAIDDSDVVVFRDTDSRITKRERYAVEEWLHSGRTLHIMRDHPYHSEPIMGGMWGCISDKIVPQINQYQMLANNLPPVDSIKKCIDLWLSYQFTTDPTKQHNAKGVDQIWLREVIYPYCYKNSLIHDSYPMYQPWSNRFEGNPREGKLGETEDNRGFPVHRIQLAKNNTYWHDFVGQVYDENETPNEEYMRLIKEKDANIYAD